MVAEGRGPGEARRGWHMSSQRPGRETRMNILQGLQKLPNSHFSVKVHDRKYRLFIYKSGSDRHSDKEK